MLNEAVHLKDKKGCLLYQVTDPQSNQELCITSWKDYSPATPSASSSGFNRGFSPLKSEFKKLYS